MRFGLTVVLTVEISGKEGMHRQFLSGLVRAEPDWSLMQYPHTAGLPALRWKLANLETFRKRRPADFQAQAEALDAGLNRVGALG